MSKLKSKKSVGSKGVRKEDAPKVNRSYTVVNSDRGELIQQANSLIAVMQHKMIIPYYSSSLNPEPLELDAIERKAYDSALEYVARQFTIGHRESDVVETGITHAG